MVITSLCYFFVKSIVLNIVVIVLIFSKIQNIIII